WQLSPGRSRLSSSAHVPARFNRPRRTRHDVSDELTSIFDAQRILHRTSSAMLPLREWWDLLKQAAFAWIDDAAASMGAALAYYTTFSLAPMLVIAIAVAGFVFGPQAAHGELVHQLGGVVGD